MNESGIEVPKPPRADWTTVTAPVITNAEQKDDSVDVTVTTNIGYDGADKIAVTMFDAQGKEIETKILLKKAVKLRFHSLQQHPAPTLFRKSNSCR